MPSTRCERAPSRGALRPWGAASSRLAPGGGGVAGPLAAEELAGLLRFLNQPGRPAPTREEVTDYVTGAYARLDPAQRRALAAAAFDAGEALGYLSAKAEVGVRLRAMMA